MYILYTFSFQTSWMVIFVLLVRKQTEGKELAQSPSIRPGKRKLQI